MAQSRRCVSFNLFYHFLRPRKDATYTHAAHHPILKCSRRAKCADACPEGINAMKMVRVGQMSAMGSLGLPAEQAKLSGREAKDFFRVINAYSQTQMSAGQVEKWQR